MSVRSSSWLAVIAAALWLCSAAAPAETLYFKNKRTIDAKGYEIKGPIIYITMANGKRVYMRADTVDWEATERIKSTDVVLEKVDYSLVDQEPGQEEPPVPLTGAGGPLTAADLKKVGAGLRLRRASSPPREVEVGAEFGWVDTRVTVRAGQHLSVLASGEVSLGGGLQADPQGRVGSAAGASGIEPDLPQGALLLRVGLGGEVLFVGRTASLRAPTAGRVYLAVNDKTPEDNSGSFLARIKVSGGSSRARGNLSDVTPLEEVEPGAAPPPPPPPAPGSPPNDTEPIE